MTEKKLCGNIVIPIKEKEKMCRVRRALQQRIKTRRFLHSLDRGDIQDQINEFKQKHR